MTLENIEIISVGPAARERGFFDKDKGTSGKEVPVSKLRESWKDVGEALQSIFASTPHVEGYELSEVTLSLAISAEGKFQLIAGGSVKGEATVQVKITKQTKDGA